MRRASGTALRWASTALMLSTLVSCIRKSGQETGSQSTSLARSSQKQADPAPTKTGDETEFTAYLKTETGSYCKVSPESLEAFQLDLTNKSWSNLSSPDAGKGSTQPITPDMIAVATGKTSVRVCEKGFEQAAAARALPSAENAPQIAGAKGIGRFLAEINLVIGLSGMAATGLGHMDIAAVCGTTGTIVNYCALKSRQKD